MQSGKSYCSIEGRYSFVACSCQYVERELGIHGYGFFGVDAQGMGSAFFAGAWSMAKEAHSGKGFASPNGFPYISQLFYCNTRSDS
jgi:hypothetical protein